ncbi:MAG TPA: hypothetical protein VHC42_11945 [Rhizomicrobium sp.]|nr:hypothetical protein [Rhizomicrobium sp.]
MVAAPPLSDAPDSGGARADKWPRAWRLLFLVGAAIASWAVIVFGARLI